MKNPALVKVTIYSCIIVTLILISGCYSWLFSVEDELIIYKQTPNLLGYMVVALLLSGCTFAWKWDHNDNASFKKALYRGFMTFCASLILSIIIIPISLLYVDSIKFDSNSIKYIEKKPVWKTNTIIIHWNDILKCDYRQDHDKWKGPKVRLV